MDDQTHRVFDALTAHDCRESYEVRTYRAKHKPPGGKPQTLVLRVLDRGGRLRRQGLRFIVEAETEDGCVYTGESAADAATALDALPWERLADGPAA